MAAHLAAAGKKVTLVEMVGELATDLETRSRLTLLQLLKERGVKILTNWKLERIENGYVLLVDRDWNKQEIAANSVILAMGLESEPGVAQAPAGKLPGYLRDWGLRGAAEDLPGDPRRGVCRKGDLKNWDADGRRFLQDKRR